MLAPLALSCRSGASAVISASLQLGAHAFRGRFDLRCRRSARRTLGLVGLFAAGSMDALYRDGRRA
jgi:hypothetical protein